MNLTETSNVKARTAEDLFCDLLVLSDGTILAHNLTPAMAKALQALNPIDETMKQRASRSSKETSPTAVASSGNP